MKYLTILFLFLMSLIHAAHLEIPMDISLKAKPATIKVLLTKLSNDANIEVKGRFHVYNGETHQLLDSGKNKWGRVTFSERGLKWGDLYPGSFKLRIVPADPHAALFVGGLPYKGCLEVYGIGGTVNLVNVIDFDNYLKATLPKTVKGPLDQEVLNALVIVERTHLAYLLQKDPKANYHLSADAGGYTGSSIHLPLIDAAVERTRGIVMFYQNHLFPAKWNTDSAGLTVSYSSIFRKQYEMPSGVTQLPSQSLREASKWSLSIPYSVLTEIADIQTLKQIELYHAEGTSKVYALRLSDDSLSHDIDFFKLQAAIGPKLLRSNDFTVELKDGCAIFTGYGEGTGVGLCLKSAQLLSERLEDARKILLVHFPGAELKRLQTPRDDLTDFIWR